jgi:hypothetical protein
MNGTVQSTALGIDLRLSGFYSYSETGWAALVARIRHHTRAIARTALRPPKANELDTAAFIGKGLASFGT